MQKTDRSVVRNEAYRKTAVGIRERHNERRNQEYKSARCAMYRRTSGDCLSIV